MLNILNKLLLAALTAFVVPACLDEAAPIETDRTAPTSDETRIDLSDADLEPAPHFGRGEIDDKATPLCQQVIETEGACAHACDGEAVMAFVPEGTCALIVCTLESGAYYKIGGCNL